jgi:hypothetical protein
MLDVYKQLDKIPTNLNNDSTYLFLSVGGNDILNNHGELTNMDISELFDKYKKLVETINTKFNNANIVLLNLYMPTSLSYQKYKNTVDEWNQLLNTFVSKSDQHYEIININSLLTTPADFVNDIEPSEIASQKIANAIYSFSTV